MTEPYTPHGFDPKVAEIYGVNAALLFQYLAYCSANSSTRWVAPTLDDLCKLYPYLGEWQIWSALQKLIHSGQKTPALVVRKQVKGVYLYRPIAADGECRSPHTFDVRIAKKVGVVAAVLYHNTGHWIRENWKRRAETFYAELDPETFDYDEAQMQRHSYQMTRGAAAYYTTAADWVAEHPYVTERTAKRAFVTLQSANLLRKGLRKRHKQFCHLTRKALNFFEQEMLSKSDLGIPSAKTQSQRPKPKPDGQNPKSTAKTQTKSRLSDCTGEVSGALIEADIKEEGLRLKKQVGDNSDAFQLPAPLADARGVSAGTASTNFTPSALHRWNSPNLPVKKPGTRRASVFKPTPDDPEYYEYIDNLTPEERIKFMSGS